MAAAPPMASDILTGRVSFVSTQDALAALIWRSMMLARHRSDIFSRDSITSFSVSVDCRSRLGFKAPYVDDTINTFKASLPLQTFLPADTHLTREPDQPASTPPFSPKGLQAAAHHVRAGINSVTGDSLRDLVAFVERTQELTPTRMAFQDEIFTYSIFMTSYFRFGMHELDFGRALGDEGRIEGFRLPSDGIYPGIPLILPWLPDGNL